MKLLWKIPRIFLLRRGVTELGRLSVRAFLSLAFKLLNIKCREITKVT